MSDMELDPTIAALLAESSSGPSQLPSFKDIAPEPPKGGEPEPNSSSMSVDLSVTHFAPITKVFEDTPHQIFNDPSYYKTALSGEGDQAQRVHQVLSKYLTCTDPKDRTVYRQQMITAFWELIRVMCPKMADPNVAKSKKMLIRYGVVLPSLFSPEQKDFFSKAILENNTGEPVYYMDEWFKEIAAGRLTLSATDEARPARKAGSGNASAEQQHLMQLKSKNDGKFQSAESFVNAKESQRQMMEMELKNRIDALCEHVTMMGLEPHKMPYSDAQKKLFLEISQNKEVQAESGIESEETSEDSSEKTETPETKKLTRAE